MSCLDGTSKTKTTLTELESPCQLEHNVKTLDCHRYDCRALKLIGSSEMRSCGFTWPRNDDKTVARCTCDPARCHGNWCLSLRLEYPTSQTVWLFFLLFLQSFQSVQISPCETWKKGGLNLFYIWPRQAFTLWSSRSSQALIQRSQRRQISSFRFAPVYLSPRRRNWSCGTELWYSLVRTSLCWINHTHWIRIIVFSFSSTLVAAASRISSFAL